MLCRTWFASYTWYAFIIASQELVFFILNLKTWSHNDLGHSDIGMLSIIVTSVYSALPVMVTWWCYHIIYDIIPLWRRDSGFCHNDITMLSKSWHHNAIKIMTSQCYLQQSWWYHNGIGQWLHNGTTVMVISQWYRSVTSQWYHSHGDITMVSISDFTMVPHSWWYHNGITSHSDITMISVIVTSLWWQYCLNMHADSNDQTQVYGIF